MNEIERKWIISDSNLPNLVDLPGIPYERHFLFVDHGIEIRIQKKGDKFEFERKTSHSGLHRSGKKFEISEQEFQEFKKLSKSSLSRISYHINGDPDISIKIYTDKFSGLIRAEVEFDNEESAKKYMAPKWFGNEITNSNIGRDSRLVKLSTEEFKKELEECMGRLNL